MQVWTAQREADQALWGIEFPRELRKRKPDQQQLPGSGPHLLGPGLRDRSRLRSPTHPPAPGRLIQPGLARGSSCLLKLGQHNSLLVLVFALAIRIADLTGLIGAEEQNLAQPFVGIDLGRERRGV